MTGRFMMLKKISEALTTPETKPFWLTSEFWLSVGAALNTGVISDPKDAKTLALDAIVVVYTLARGLAKSGSGTEPEEGTAPTNLPTQAGDVPLLHPPANGSGTKGVETGEPTAVPTPKRSPGELAAMIREAVSESPEVLQQLRSEGVL